MELPEQQRIRAEAEGVVRRAGGRRRRTVEIGREQAAVARPEREALLRGGLAREHLGAVVRADLRAGERRPVPEHVEARVVGVGPDSELRVVGEVRVLERVAIVRAGRVAARRDGDALEVRRRRDGELADDPAIGDPVVRDGRVAVVVRLAPAAEAAPERVRRHRSVERDPGLVEDRETRIDDLDVVERPDGAVRIGRRRRDAERPRGAAEALADSLEVRAQRRSRRVTDGRLHDRVRRRRRRGDRVLVLRMLLLRVGSRTGRRRHVAQRQRRVVVDRGRRIGGGLAVPVVAGLLRARGRRRRHDRQDTERRGYGGGEAPNLHRFLPLDCVGDPGRRTGRPPRVEQDRRFA